MQIAFLMDRFDSINPIHETTSYMMYECNQRGHTVFFLEPHDVYIRNNEVVARMHNITVPPDHTCSFQLPFSGTTLTDTINSDVTYDIVCTPIDV